MGSESDEDYFLDDSSMLSDENEDFAYLEDDGGDLGFDSVMDNSANRRKSYEVEYSIHSVQDMTQSQDKEVAQVSGILGLAPQHTATLLRYFRWNKEKLLERYMDAPAQVMKAAGVVTDEATSPKFLPASVFPHFQCDICCDDDHDLQTLTLDCGHRFCNNCYKYYLIQKIREEGESRRIQCPQDGCSVIVDENTVKLVVDDKTHERYRTLLNRTYVDDSDYLKWCPAPNCEYAIECHVAQNSLTSIIPTVTCECEHRFCFGCSLPDHQPCICVLVKHWIKKCADDSETANWISAHTKECPKCRSTIEKNGGCNHMTCRKCRYEFCWVCMGPWAEHGTSWYNCNRFDEKSSSDARDMQAKSRASLERYLHYYNRFANHEQSAKLDRDLYYRTEKKMEEMQQTSDLSWIEVQFLKKAVDTLVQCRTTLKWTYAFAFYLQKNNQTEIFEDNQRDLEMATEQLSELLEKPIVRSQIADLRQLVLDKSVYVGTRREILLEDTTKGLLEGRWEYIVSIK